MLSKKLAVFGGNGYVGQAVISNALKYNIQVVSINRSGAPADFDKRSPLASRKGTVTWHKGDIFREDQWKDVLKGCDGVVSCVGAFGTTEFMEMINGDANINAIRVAKEIGVPRFAYISTVENTLPILHGYFNGKKRAEAYLQETYGDTTDNSNNNSSERSSGSTPSYAILRPSFVYGTRMAGNIPIPLWLAGRPMEMVFSNPLFRTLRNTLPGMQAILAAPVSVEHVACTALVGALGSEYFGLHGADSSDDKAIKNVDEIRRVGTVMEQKMKGK